jgi:hypothetical protein
VDRICRSDFGSFEMKLTKIRALIKKCFRPLYLYRDSVSGEFVSSQYAQEHPHTTTRQRILFPRGGHHK